ncbi:MAG TPA: hypothetical protein DCQ58_03700 [Saprospirales bacterium]|nr:hypothetical protein [Saprospirales bacterium]
MEDLIKNKFKMLIEIKHKELKYIENGVFKFDDTLKGFDKSSLVLSFPDNFDFSEFLKFAISIDVSKHIKMPKEPDNELIKIKNSLVSIYSELRNQLNSLYL